MRKQENVLAVAEARLLAVMCRALPPSVTPDRLTTLGVLAALIIFAAYAASNVHAGFLWLASLGYVLHWFGDSLDGSLARARGIERPRYGHFLDHSVDAICNAVILTGLGLSPFVRLDAALAALIGYLLLTIHVCLKDRAQSVFQLSFLALGPTELRLILIALNTAMWFWRDAPLFAGPPSISVYDAVLLLGAFMFVLIFIVETATTLRALSASDPVRDGASIDALVPKQP